MHADWGEIRDLVLRTLEATALEQAAVYIEPAVHDTGSTVAMGRDTAVADEPSILAFADLAPHMNWSHPCRYLIVGLTTHTVRSVQGQFPPAAERLRLIYRGKRVEDWMLLTLQPLIVA